MKKNWLSENIASIIALAFVAFAFFVFRMILLKQVNASETIVTAILGSVTNIVMLIVGFYFGSSQSSKQKTEMMNKIEENQNK